MHRLRNSRSDDWGRGAMNILEAIDAMREGKYLISIDRFGDRKIWRIKDAQMQFMCLPNMHEWQMYEERYGEEWSIYENNNIQNIEEIENKIISLTQELKNTESKHKNLLLKGTR